MPTPSSTAVRTDRTDPSHLTILIADGNADMRLYVQRCLRLLHRPLGQVLEAADGPAALQLAHDVALDLVIGDVQLPGMDGYALRRALADTPVQVLLLSDLSQTEEAPDATVLGKPFNAQTLCRRIRALIDPGGGT